MMRRTFLRQALLAPLASLAAAAAWLQSCGGGSDYATGGAACDGRAPAVGMALGHTHPACVPMAALSAGGAYTLTLGATAYAPHTHTFALSSADMATLQGGGSVSGLSSFDAANTHQHTVAF